MKSDQFKRSTKERSKSAQDDCDGFSPFLNFGEMWLITDLLEQAPEEIFDEKDLLADCLECLKASPVARAMIKEAADHGWRIGMAPREQHDFHLDVPEKMIILTSNGYEAEAVARAPHVYHTLLIALVRALRDVWQERRHGGFEDYVAESVLMLERVRAADGDAVTILIGWELREYGYMDLWRHIISSDDGDIGMAFSNAIERGANTHKALAASFAQWFRSETRVNNCDHETLEQMDELLELEPGYNVFGRKRAGKLCIEVLSCLPDKTAYMRGAVAEVLADPLYAGLSDSINQSHFMQIVRDTQLVYVQGVGFSDLDLADKIFPNGEMTPELQSVSQKN